MDYNLTGRAEIKNNQHIITKQIHRDGNPKTKNFALNLNDNQMIALSDIRINCIAGYSSGVPYPPSNLPRIVVKNIIDQPCSIGTTLKFNPMTVIDINNRDVQIHSDQFFEITIILKGTLYTLNPGKSISHKECVGFAMLNHDNQGRTILDEGAMDAMNDYILQQGGPDLRELPFGMASLNMLPRAFQNVIAGKIFAPHVYGSFALPEAAKLQALPLEDITYRDFLSDALNTNVDIDLKKLKELARKMMELGWAKFNE